MRVPDWETEADQKQLIWITCRQSPKPLLLPVKEKTNPNIYRIPITGTTGILIQVKVKLQTKITDCSQYKILPYSKLKFPSINNNNCPIYGVLHNNNSPYLMAATTKSNRSFTETTKTGVPCHSGVAHKNALFAWKCGNRNFTALCQSKNPVSW